MQIFYIMSYVVKSIFLFYLLYIKILGLSQLQILYIFKKSIRGLKGTIV